MEISRRIVSFVSAASLLTVFCGCSSDDKKESTDLAMQDQGPVEVLEQDSVQETITASVTSALRGDPCVDEMFELSQQVYGTGTEPYFVAVGDLDSDGNLDLAVANRSGGDVVILMGDGTGVFSTAANFGTFDMPNSIAIGDLDKDTNPDLVVTNSNWGIDIVSVRMGNGAGGFGGGGDYVAGTGPYSVALGYLDGDGNLDLAVANMYDNNVSVMLGDGAGGFAAAVDHAVGTGPFSVAIEDLDGDSNMDLVTANYFSDDASVLMGDGTGNFAAAVHYGAGSGPRSVAIDDLDKDGNPDLAVANLSSNDVSVLLGNGDGTFGPDSTHNVGTGPESVAINDLDDDGNPDLVTANRDTDNVSVLLGDGAGGFATAENYGTNEYPVHASIGDFDNDGAPDLAVANAHSHNVTVLMNDCSGAPSGCQSDADCTEDDGDLCTIPTCDTGSGQCSEVQQSPNCCDEDSDCLDSNPCNHDYCLNAQCRHSHNFVAGCCYAPPAINPLTLQPWAPGERQAYADMQCDDKNPCTEGDHCDMGTNQCEQGTPVQDCCSTASDCMPTPSDPCQNYFCINKVCIVLEKYSDCCTQDSDCEDGNACTNDVCTINNKCRNLFDPTSCCPDDAWCVLNDNDNNPCTDELCVLVDAQTGEKQCENVMQAQCSSPLPYIQEFDTAPDFDTIGWGFADYGTNAAADHWHLNTTGGLGPDQYLEFIWNPTVSDVMSVAYTPLIDASTAGLDIYNVTDTTTLQWRMSYEHSQPGETVTLRVVACEDGDFENGHILWEQAVSDDLEYGLYSAALPNGLDISSNLQVGFMVYASSTFFLDSWSVDDVKLASGVPNELTRAKVLQCTTPTCNVPGEVVEIDDSLGYIPDVTMTVGEHYRLVLCYKDDDASPPTWNYYGFPHTWSSGAPLDDPAFFASHLMNGPSSCWTIEASVNAMCDVSTGSKYFCMMDIDPQGLVSNAGIYRVGVLAQDELHADKVQHSPFQSIAKTTLNILIEDGYIIWSPRGMTNLSAVAMEQAIEANGRDAQIVEDITIIDDLTVYDGIFVVLGVYGDYHELTGVEGMLFRDFLDAGGRLYLEGADFFFLTANGGDQDWTAVHPYFKTEALSDGTSKITDTIEGRNTLYGYSFDYSQSPLLNSWNDEIRHVEGAGGREVLHNDGTVTFATAVTYDSGVYRTIGSSILFGGIEDNGNGTPNELMNEYLNFLEYGYRDCTQDEQCDDFEYCTDPDACNAGTCSNPDMDPCVCVKRVDNAIPDDSGDGETWGTAKKTIQAAIDAARAEVVVWGGPDTCEVWVKAGLYPIYVSDRSDTLDIESHVHVYGGFAGTEMSRSERVCIPAATVLDGQGQSYHVVSAQYVEDVVLDCFEVKDGLADGGGSNGRGAGIFGNHADDLTLSNNRIIDNTTSGTGGGAYLLQTSDESSVITDCDFVNNTASTNGGGLRVSSGRVEMSGCTFDGNGAEDGGGVYEVNTTLATFTNGTFENNSATSDGGAWYSQDGTATTLTNCVVSGNTSQRAGGISNYNSVLRVTNCTVYGNTATSTGGGLRNTNGGDGTVVNSIFWGNSGSSGDQIHTTPSSTATVAYSDVQDWPGAGSDGNIDAHPLFADAPSGDLNLTAGSPCIDAGDGDVAPATDKDGNGRHDDTGTGDTGTGTPVYADMGAYEFQGTTVTCNDANCDACSDPDTCTECATGWYLWNDGCVDACPLNTHLDVDTCVCNPGYYFDDGLGDCAACHPYCEECYGGNSDDCTACNPGYFLQGNTCVGCEPHCSACTDADTCTECGSGWYLLNNDCFDDCSTQGAYFNDDTAIPPACTPCSTGCLTCADGATCTSCIDGYYMNVDVCSPCHPSCATCFGQTQNDCIACNPGYFMEGSTCTACESNCDECSDLDTCTECSSGWYLLNGDCFSDCPAQGAYFNDDTAVPPACTPCSTGCITCTDATTCTSCATGYFLDGDDCTACEPNCDACSDATTCTDCSVGYFLVGGDCPCLQHVALNGDNSDGTTWAKAYTSLQPAIDAAAAAVIGGAPYCEVWVKGGTYAIYQSARTDTVTMKEGVRVYGGFAGTETARTDRDWVVNETILDGLDQSYHVVTATGLADAVLNGFTVTKGLADAGLAPEGFGGGIYVFGGTPILRNLHITGNSALWGGGVAVEDGASPQFKNCVFDDNEAVGDGIMWHGMGGAIVVNGTTPKLVNCTLHDNTASVDGGFSQAGGGAIAVMDGTLTIKNSILWGNTATIDPEIHLYALLGTPAVAVSYSDVEGGYVGTGNIDADPHFADAAGSEYDLVFPSPCIDAADGSSPSKDHDNNGRVDVETVIDTGTGTPTWTDMGAFEYQSDADDSNWNFETWVPGEPIEDFDDPSATHWSAMAMSAPPYLNSGSWSAGITVDSTSAQDLDASWKWTGVPTGTDLTAHLWVYDDADARANVGLRCEDSGGSVTGGGDYSYSSYSNDEAAWTEFTTTLQCSADPNLHHLTGRIRTRLESAASGSHQIVLDDFDITYHMTFTLGDGTLDNWTGVYPTGPWHLAEPAPVAPWGMNAWLALNDEGLLYAATDFAPDGGTDDHMLFVWVGEPSNSQMINLPWSKSGQVPDAGAGGGLFLLIQEKSNGYCEWRQYSGGAWNFVSTNCNTGSILEGNVDVRLQMGLGSATELPSHLYYTVFHVGDMNGGGLNPDYQTPPWITLDGDVQYDEVMQSEIHRARLLVGRIR